MQLAEARSYRQFLARRLRVIRADCGYSQEYVANEIGIRRATLSSYETGETTPDYERLIELAQFYEVSSAYFFPEDVR